MFMNKNRQRKYEKLPLNRTLLEVTSIIIGWEEKIMWIIIECYHGFYHHS